MALIMATCVAAFTLAAPPATAQPSGPLSLTSLAFASKRVDVRENSAVVALNWTVRNTDTTATNLTGSLQIRMVGDAPGAYVGQSYHVDFQFGETWYTRARFVSGTPQESTYQYDFTVPRYGRTAQASWVVSSFVVTDDKGASLSIEGSQLAPYRSALKVRTLVDSTPPGMNWFYLEPLSTPRPYAYVRDKSAHLDFYAQLQDWESGFWKGTLRLTGPSGELLTSDFESRWFHPDPRCGPYTGGDINSVSCGITVDVPAGTTAGTWQVSGLVLFDNVGNQTTVTPPDPTPISVTSNEVVSAANFAAVPNPVNNWTQNATTRIRMDVTGTQNGVGTVRLDFDTHGCRQDNGEPVVDPDGGISVGVFVSQGTAKCVVTGLVIVDGAGNVAVYGSRYEAPGPGLTINRLPNTTPPAVSAATLTPTTVTRSEAPNVWPTLTMQVTAPIAPVNQYALYLYDAVGNIVAQQSGGTSGAGPDGTLRLYGYLPYDIAAGTYSYGFTLYDASGLRSSYGVNGQPLAGGPLEITVTDD
ncbi:hypothetical protein AB0M79_07985 [Polymorphospora sp. NPDC051019]|uniref:hypothetical protein n=1 Tax=Polymorphospora sp. NPDC051019 TaxID=3155725 RepID=UPI00343C962C